MCVDPNRCERVRRRCRRRKRWRRRRRRWRRNAARATTRPTAWSMHGDGGAGWDSTIISPALTIGLIGPSSSAAIRTWSGPDNAAATAANCVCDCVRNCIPQPTSLLVLLTTASATAELCSQLRLARMAVYTSASFSSRLAALDLADPLAWAFKLRFKALLARARFFG